MYLLRIINQDYSNYKLVNNSKIELEYFNPEHVYGMFDGDMVDIIDGQITKIKDNSPTYIVGELELFSKYSFKPNKKNTPCYMFRPLDKKYPKFLVNSTLKRNSTKNVLVTIQIHKWEKNTKFPRGLIVKNLGEINDKKAIQESLLLKRYLAVKSLKCSFKDIPLQFENICKHSIDREILSEDIISIDPEGCRDIDDAFSLRPKNKNIIVDIHISDVYYVLTRLNIFDKVQNVTSIYLDSYIKGMLPDVISSNVGSLLEKKNRFMLSIEIIYNSEDNSIVSTRLRKTFGMVRKNYSYDNYPKKYNKYFDCISKIYSLITNQDMEIYDSHKFIEALMIIYNTLFSKIISKKSLQIYRIQQYNYDKKAINNCDKSLERFMNLIQSNSAIYSTEKEGHSTLKISDYTHATSPLRRIVDLMNQEILYSNNCSLLQKIDLNYINSFNKNLKKAYRDIHKILLAFNVYHNKSYSTKCYIYDFNLESKSCYLFFPDENMSIKTKLISYKLADKFIIHKNDSNIILTCEESGCKNEIELMKELKVQIYGKPNIFEPDKSIIVDFGIFSVQ